MTKKIPDYLKGYEELLSSDSASSSSDYSKKINHDQ
jgi:hypothetical protein